MTDAVQGTLDYLKTAFDTLRPDPEETVIEFAEKHIIIPPEMPGPWPGKVDFDNTPYLRGPLEAYSAPFIRHIVGLFARQLGKSFGFHEVPACYEIARRPAPISFILPNDGKCREMSEDKLQHLFNNCKEVIRKRTSNPNDYATLRMRFVDCVLKIFSTGNSKNLMGGTFKNLHRDELDEFQTTAASSADPLISTEEMVSTYYDHQIIDTSTPTDKHGPIWKQFKSCQRIFEFWVPCPECSEKQVLIWSQIRFDSKEDPEAVFYKTHYECIHCNFEILESHKFDMVRAGEWRARKERGSKAALRILENKDREITKTILLADVLKDYTIRKIGFHLPKWYGLFPNSAFGNAARRFLQAHLEKKETGTSTDMRDFTKFVRGLPYEETIKSPIENEILNNRIEVMVDMCPPNTVAVTAGVDQGQGGYWYLFVAWHGEQNQFLSPHIIKVGFVMGKIELAKILHESTFKVMGAKQEIGIFRSGLDTGGSKYDIEDITMTQSAYEFLHEYGMNCIFGTKGLNKPLTTGRRLKYALIDKDPKGNPIPGGIELWHIDGGAFKDSIVYRLGLKAQEVGRLTLYKEADKTLARHLSSEEKVPVKNGPPVWRQKFSANHWLDCLVIALALGDKECWGGVYEVLPNVPVRPPGMIDGGLE